MIYQEILPSPELRELVKNYLIVNLKSDSDFPTTPYPARIEQAILFFARGYIECSDPQNKQTIRIARNAVFGQQVSRLTFQSIAQNDFMMIMVVFQPGGLHQFLKIPAFELSGHFCDAEQFLGSELRSVNDAIANTSDYKKMITYVEHYLRSKKSTFKFEGHRVDNVCKILQDSPDKFSLDYLADQAALSSRQLERKFQERFGIGPKTYQRISRFYKAFEFKEKNPDLDWLTIALSFGYTDYYHLVKDSKQFSCVTPNILIEEYARRPEAVLRKFMRHLL